MSIHTQQILSSKCKAFWHAAELINSLEDKGDWVIFRMSTHLILKKIRIRLWWGRYSALGITPNWDHFARLFSFGLPKTLGKLGCLMLKNVFRCMCFELKVMCSDGQNLKWNPDPLATWPTDLCRSRISTLPTGNPTWFHLCYYVIPNSAQSVQG